jgi:opine dehydrogenase
MRYGILGSGAGGQSLAYEFATKKMDVLIADLPDFQSQIEAISAKGGITRRTPDGEETFQSVKTAKDVREVTETCDIIFISCTAFGMRAFGKACKPYIREGQIFILTPDTGGGVLEFRNELGLALDDSKIITAGSDTLPYAARVLAPGVIRIKLFATSLKFAALPAAARPVAEAALKAIWPDDEKIVFTDNIMRIVLENTNPVIHPAVTLLNASRIQNTKGEFIFYHEGVTDASADLMEAVDNERLALGAALGMKLLTEPEGSYAAGYIDADKINYRDGYNKSKNFGITKAPDTLDHRYFNEDVGYGLVFWSSLGDLLGVDTPVIDALTLIISRIMGKDYKSMKLRTVETLGLTADNIHKL